MSYRFLSRIPVKNSMVELDGDEMARVMWSLIKDTLIFPHLEIDIKYYDLSLQNRDATEDSVTLEAAEAIETHKVGVKCATITADSGRVQEFSLKRMWKSPNGTIRNHLQGTIFRAPIVFKNIPRLIPGWERPIIIARHAYADQYSGRDIVIRSKGAAALTFTPADGSAPTTLPIHSFDSPGVLLGMFNTECSIRDFARTCLSHGLSERFPVFFTTKSTILAAYDGFFRDVFQEVFESEFAAQFNSAGLTYEHRLIDDMVAQVLKSTGGFLWACKNYDGDVLSDMVAQGYGSLGLMTSVLLNHHGALEAEAAHGTVTRHFRVHQRGEETSTNSIASIFAWTRGLAHRARLDGNMLLLQFAERVEQSVKEVVEDGQMTKDLALCVHGKGVRREQYVTTEEFIRLVGERLKEKLVK